MLNLRSRPSRFLLVVASVAAIAVVPVSSNAATKSTKRPVTKKTVRKPKTTAKPNTTIVKTPSSVMPQVSVAPSADVRSKERVLAGYEAYFGAFVAGAREPERAAVLLPSGMSGDALSRMLEIRKLDASEGLFWDGMRADIVSSPKIEVIGEKTATIRDCRSVGGVLRNKATKQIVPGTTEPDVDDLRITLVLVGSSWVVVATELFNEEEGRSKCVPGLPSP